MHCECHICIKVQSRKMRIELKLNEMFACIAPPRNNLTLKTTIHTVWTLFWFFHLLSEVRHANHGYSKVEWIRNICYKIVKSFWKKNTQDKETDWKILNRNSFALLSLSQSYEICFLMRKRRKKGQNNKVYTCFQDKSKNVKIHISYHIQLWV